ncbi:hypothetical protein PCANB_000813 [Pneumocystis canis]|nr:hypothetical protein PCANB_000813 [Pneumocystis canis]
MILKIEGPKTDTVEIISRLRAEGTGIIRMNFSHGSYEYYRKVIFNVREVEKLYPGRPLAIALDTKGPEIRTGNTCCNKDIPVTLGHEMLISTDPQYANKCDDQILYVDYNRLCSTIKEGRILYIDDGTLSLQVLEIINPQTLKVVCLNSGMISSRKGVNLPGTDVDLPTLSEKDIKDLQFAVENGVDMIFASFIRSGEDIVAIRKILGSAADTIKVIAKVENKQGVNNFDNILKEADGIMVARGDLGIEIPQTQVFVVQKMMISKCNLAGKPCICATQMLEHMINNPRPTRAEITDISAAILDGVDCCETAKGLYPVEAVKIMRETILLAESIIRYDVLFNDLRRSISKFLSSTEAICRAAVELQKGSSAKAIVTLSSSFGLTAHLCSKYRPRVPIIMVTYNQTVARFSNLYRGVYPLLYHDTESQTTENWQENINSKVEWVIKQISIIEMIQSGDHIVIIYEDCNNMGLDEELSISTDVRERDRIRLERELEKELNGFSFSKSGFEEPSDETVRPEHVDLNQTFFADSPDTKSLNKHFKDFSMGVSASSDGSSIEKGVGLQLETLNLKNEFSKVYTVSSKSFDRPLVSDKDFATVMKSISLESTASDYGNVVAKIKQMYSPFDKKAVNANFSFAYDKNDHELAKQSPEIINKNKLAHALKKTEKKFSNIPIIERDRNIMSPEFVKIKPPVSSRLRRASTINNENIYPIQSKQNKPLWKVGENNVTKRVFNTSPKEKTIPRAFKTTSGLMQELGLDSNQRNVETNIPLNTEMTQSFQLPDMTGITSLISDGMQAVSNKIEVITKDKYKNLESIPISSDDKAILLAIRALQNNINELETRELTSKKRIQNLEKELENTKQLYLEEQKRCVETERNQEINKNENSHYNCETPDRKKLSHTMECMRLKNEVSALKSQVETLEHELSVSKSKINNIKEEKNEVLKKLMETVSEIDQLKLENKKLIKEVENFKKTYKLKKTLDDTKQKASEFCPKSSKKKKVSAKTQLESDVNETDDEILKKYKSDSTETDREEISDVSKFSYRVKNDQPLKMSQTSRKSFPVSVVSTRNSKKKNKLDAGKNCKKSKSILQNRPEKRTYTSATTDSETSDDTSEYDYSKEYSSNDDILLKQEPAWIQVENKLKTKLNKSRQAYNNESKQNVRSKSYMDVNPQKIIEGLARHNPTSCSVCSRKRQKEIASLNKLNSFVKTKQPENVFEEENTLRPSMSPKNALSMVITQLEDEFKHLKLKYQEFIQSYEKIDPAVGKKKRKALVGKLKNIIEKLEAKADQIYALYDVTEITKESGNILKKVLKNGRTDV